MTGTLELRGLVVATVLPFTPNGEIDWESYRKLLDFCAVPDIVSAVFVNGHAGEGAALTDEERVAVLRETRSAVGSKPILSGVIATSTAGAVQQAKIAEQAGADCVVPFPMSQFAAGGTLTKDAPLAYFEAIAEAVNIPLSIFQQSIAAGMGYSFDTLAAMLKMPQVICIKEGGDSISHYEDNWRHLKQINPNVSILPSNYDWFLPQLAIGADGILSGLGSLLPHDLYELWQATRAEDLASMRAINARLHPLVRSIYGAPPRMDMHTRIKAALEHLGIISCSRPRAPLMPLSASIAADVVRTISAHQWPAGASFASRA